MRPRKLPELVLTSGADEEILREIDGSLDDAMTLRIAKIQNQGC